MVLVRTIYKFVIINRSGDPILHVSQSSAKHFLTSCSLEETLSRLQRLRMASSTPLIWLITGTSSGFGNCLVGSVLARGDRVIATARSLESPGVDHLLQLQRDNPENVCVRQLDVTAGAEAIGAVVAEAVGVWGRIDIVVSNAGAGYPGLIEEGGSALLRKQFDVNFFGVMDTCAATLPYLRAQKFGTIVIIGSRSAWKPEIPGTLYYLPQPQNADHTTLHTGHYAASKAAVHALAESLTAEVAPLGVRVLLVQPGAFRTSIASQSSSVYHTSNPIPDYDAMRGVSEGRFKGLSGTEKGDPSKAMDAVVDVVRGEGHAQGRPWPGLLVLGQDAENDVRGKCKRVLDHLDEWKDVVRGVGIDSE
ncbi:putative oxidoreductase YusZ [Mycena venus]|uniref:Putative oxidoreductase YusZ n=1 Tax=Mycena venus TaxID=2733690 RepID=A0A8H6Z2M5_9AGAR|nr:putative oxidoreductase YusZ [Mycena venus]